MNGARKIISAVSVAAIASCASYANAQTATSAQAGAAMQKVALAAPRTPHPSRPDSSIIRDVRRALRRVPQMDDSGIHIRVSLGVVTLTGSVPESWQISRAGNAARSVLGVRAVTNRLTSRDEDNGGTPAGHPPPAPAH